MMALWSFFQFCFWGPLKLLRSLKKAQILDSWPLTIPLKTRHWIRLVLKKCPVSIVYTVLHLHTFIIILKSFMQGNYLCIYVCWGHVQEAGGQRKNLSERPWLQKQMFLKFVRLEIHSFSQSPPSISNKNKNSVHIRINGSFVSFLVQKETPVQTHSKPWFLSLGIFE